MFPVTQQQSSVRGDDYGVEETALEGNEFLGSFFQTVRHPIAYCPPWVLLNSYVCTHGQQSTKACTVLNIKQDIKQKTIQFDYRCV